MKKNILGLDLGTNSIGWALIEHDFENKQGKILGMGSRIVPMDAGEMGKFAEGSSISKTADRTKYRSARRLRERNLLRRERLHRVLNVLGFLPEHYASEIDFEKHFGKFKEETEPKLVWRKNGKKKNGKDKFEFIFPELFKEMLADFRMSQPELLSGNNKKGEPFKIPYDWTIYYLRKKALEEAITKEQMAWLILNFNQKRGYYQLRGEEEVDDRNKKEFVALLKIINVEKGEVDKKNDKKNWYSITFENGWKHSFPFTTEPNWLNTEREFLVTEEYDDDGNIKIVKDKKKDTDGREKRNITTLPSFEEIELLSKKEQDKFYGKIKARTEITIAKSNKTVGSYIYDTLLQKPSQKIRGKLIRTIERKFYKDELIAILKKQIELQPELFTDDLYNACVRELYRSNEAHQLQLSQKDFVHLFVEDIIFYQRPLRSQKSAIGNCTLEYRLHKMNVKDENGNAIKNVFVKGKDGKDIEIKEFLKCIPKSNPYYQEFRVWQWLRNLKIYTRKGDYDVTNKFIAEASIDQNKHEKGLEKLYEFLMTKKEVNHIDILKHFIEPIIKEKYPDAKSKKLKEEMTKEIKQYRWNYVFDDSKEKEEDKSKKYPMNKTGYEIRERLEKVKDVPSDFLNRVKEQQLWHIIYSVTDKKEYETALESFAKKHQLYYVPKAERDTENPDKECFVYNFKNLVWTEKDYGSYSEKAIKKLLPLMRLGKYWKEDEIIKDSTKYLNNINTLIEKIDTKAKAITEKEKEDWNKTINQNLYNELLEFKNGDIDSFKGLPLHLAQYLVYGRHSELGSIDIWERSFDVQTYLYNFKQHSLRNPIVEQIITETLRTVRDIWEHYAEENQIPFEMVYDEHKKKNVKSYPKFFDEIHIELGREMKNTAEDRKEMTKQISENENTNLRIKAMLMEFATDKYFNNDADYTEFAKDNTLLTFYQKGNNPIRAYSQTQQDILKIYEEGVLQTYTDQELKDIKTGEFRKDKDGKQKEVSIYDISTTAQPSKNEITRYKLWLEQKYCSPYTGQMISLAKLFTPAYEIEHIIPKSRYFDDSLSNKVICEAEVNSLKDNQLGLEFIKNSFGQKITTIGSGEVAILTEDAYKKFVDEHYSKNKAKRNKLLLEDIPDKMIARQMNDTRYISKFVSNLLSNLVRTDKSDDGVNSKNLISSNGKITDRLKQDWGLNNVWNELILPRFERMNRLTNTTAFTTISKEGHIIPTVPFELSKGFQKKRIDHRHHAMDALVIACVTRDHVNLLNNQSANTENNRKDLQNKLRNKEKWLDSKGNERDKFTEFKLPWEHFVKDAKDNLESIVVSFKQNLRVINKATNTYQKFENGKKIEKRQEGMNWAIRKTLHKEFVFGKVNLHWEKVPKGKVNVAIRRTLSPSIDLNKLTDTAIRKILRNYLAYCIKMKKNEIMADKPSDEKNLKNQLKELIDKPEAVAFTPEGIECLNNNIMSFNNGKFHKPIYKVRVYEVCSRFPLGQNGNKKDKYVETADGTNLFFVVYESKDTKDRMFDTVPLNEVIEHQKLQVSLNIEKSKRTEVPIKNVLEHKNKKIEVNYLFHLSPNDLVYVPTEEELINISSIDFSNLTIEQKKRIYKFTDGSGKMANFIPANIANVLFNINKDKQKKTFGKELFPIQNEIGVGSQGSKNENAFTGEQIKAICIKLKVDRLGNISKVTS